MEQQQQQQPTQQYAAAPKSESSRDIEKWTGIVNDRLQNTDVLLKPEGTGEWSSGFFECFDPIDTCLLTCFCPCVTFGRTYHRIHKGDDSTWSPVNASCLGWYVASIFGCGCVANQLQRSEIRERSTPKLRGDFITDFAKAFCCGCCDLVQQDKESRRLAQQSVPLVTQQPMARANEGMQYPA